MAVIMKEYLIKYRNDTLWNSRGREITSNYNTEVVSAESAKKAVAQIYNDYKNILNSPTRSLEILSVKLIG